MKKQSLLALLLVLVAALGLVYLVVRQGLPSPGRSMECTLSDRAVVPEGDTPFPPVGEADWTWGPEDAAVTIVEYGDFQCPHCGELAPALAQLRSDYPEDLRLVYRHFPLETLHDKARLAAQASEAAGAQGEFWPMHDLLYGQQSVWAESPSHLFELWLVDQARELGLDAERFAADLDSQDIIAAIEQAHQGALDTGLSGTPTLAINGQYYEGPMDAWTLAAYIELIKLKERQFHQCPPLEISARRRYTATLQTTQGDIVIGLLPQQAPLAVNSFVYLARQGWYDGVPFHRVIPGYVTQTGDPSGTGLGGPGYTFPDEIVPDALFDRAGLVGMANAGPDENGSQFFITYAPQESLNGKYTIFGHVIAGMDVATSLTVRDPATDPVNLPSADQILRVTIEEK